MNKLLVLPLVILSILVTPFSTQRSQPLPNKDYYDFDFAKNDLAINAKLLFKRTIEENIINRKGEKFLYEYEVYEEINLSDAFIDIGFPATNVTRPMNLSFKFNYIDNTLEKIKPQVNEQSKGVISIDDINLIAGVARNGNNGHFVTSPESSWGFSFEKKVEKEEDYGVYLPMLKVINGSKIYQKFTKSRVNEGNTVISRYVIDFHSVILSSFVGTLKYFKDLQEYDTFMKGTIPLWENYHY